MRTIESTYTPSGFGADWSHCKQSRDPDIPAELSRSTARYLLSRDTSSPVAGQGLAGTTESASPGVAPSDLDPASRRSSPSLRTTRRPKQHSERSAAPESKRQSLTLTPE